MEDRTNVPHINGDFSEGKTTTEQKPTRCPAKKELPEPNHASLSVQTDNHDDWCYIYLHNRRIEAFQAYMNESSPFRSFVLKARPIRRDKTTNTSSSGKSKDAASPAPRQLLIGGIVFIQGTPEAVQHFFQEKSLFLTLVHDCATQRPAILSDEIMRPLRQVVELASERISFLPKPFAHYAEGHVPVRVIEGPLKGLEGCILRINKDRKLVMQVGKLTIAIARAHREVFEPVTSANPQPQPKPRLRKLTYLQEQLDKNLFFPQTQSEVTMYADNVALLIDHALKLLKTDKAEVLPTQGKTDTHGKSEPHQELSTDMLLFLLEEIAYHFDTPTQSPRFNLAPIHSIVQTLLTTISQLVSPSDPRLSATEKERLSLKCDAITLGKDWLFHA